MLYDINLIHHKSTTIFSPIVDNHFVIKFLNSVDIIIIVPNNIDSNAHGALQSYSSSTSPCSDTGTETAATKSESAVQTEQEILLSNQSISIVLIGDLNLSPLTSNVSIEFLEEHDKNQHDVICVWFDVDAEIWRDDGCMTVIDPITESVGCLCSHLTTFAIAHSLKQDDNGCGSFINNLQSNIHWDYLHTAFAVIFCIILYYALFIQLLPFCRNKNYKPSQHKALGAVTMVVIIAILNISLCIYFSLIGTKLIKANNVLLTFLLLSPQWFYFILFGIVLYSLYQHHS